MQVIIGPVSESLHKEQVGRRLRAAIEALNLIPADVCKTFGQSPSKLGNWLRGTHYPSEWFIKQFCDRYGVTTDWIYRGIVSGMDARLADALWKSEGAASTVQPVAEHKAARRTAVPPPKGRDPPRPTLGGRVAKRTEADCAGGRDGGGVVPFRAGRPAAEPERR